MITQTVMDEIAAKLDEISGLRVHAYAPDRIVPPAVFVTLPELSSFDETLDAGMDKLLLNIVVLVGKSLDRISSEEMAGYISGSGSTSVRAKLNNSTYTSCDVVTVQSARTAVVKIAGVEYLGGLFPTLVFGQGGA